MRPAIPRTTGACLLLGSLLGLLPVPVAASGVTHRETQSREFELAKVDGRRKLIVDTVWGAIRVTGRKSAGDTVKMKVTKRIEAASEGWLERARSEVELEVFADPGTLELFVDGPWRDRHDRHEWARNGADVDYEVTYDFVIEVPTDTDLQLETVVNGDVEITAVAGRHDVSNVTGDVRLRGVSGSGRFETVSGSVSGTFAGQPSGPSKWKTVSGDLDIALTPDLDADFLLASSWGEIWSEFPVEPLPALPARTSTHKGKFVLSAANGARFRVGAGGPELHFETLSGDARIRKHKGD